MPKKKSQPAPKRRSITLTALVCSYILVMLIGVCLAAVQLAQGKIDLSVSMKGFKLSTGSIGLAMVVFGGFMAGLVALKLPKGVQIFSPGARQSKMEAFARKAGLPLFLLGLLALAAIILGAMR